VRQDLVGSISGLIAAEAPTQAEASSS
jgi:hypothetical protein